MQGQGTACLLTTEGGRAELAQGAGLPGAGWEGALPIPGSSIGTGASWGRSSDTQVCSGEQPGMLRESSPSSLRLWGGLRYLPGALQPGKPETSEELRFQVAGLTWGHLPAFPGAQDAERHHHQW